MKSYEDSNLMKGAKYQTALPEVADQTSTGLNPTRYPRYLQDE